MIESITKWLKGLLVAGTMSNLTGLFDSINEEVEDIAAQVGQTPAGWNGSIYSMVHTLSESVSRSGCGFSPFSSVSA